MARNLRVCIVLPKIYPVLSGSTKINVVGGAEVQHTLAALSLAKSGIDVSVISLDYGQSDCEDISGVTVFKTHKPNGGIPVIRFFFPRLFRTWQALRRADSDIYYQPCAGYLTGVVVLFCRLYGRASIFAGASDTDFIPDRLTLNSFRDRCFYQWGMRNVDAVVTQTDKQANLCHKSYKRDSTIIRNGYAAPYSLPTNERNYVLWVGRIYRVKRPDRILDIARRLPNVSFRIIGGQENDSKEAVEYYENIKLLATKLSNVEFLGFLPYEQAERYFDHATVFVNTSEIEGFPNTFLQAWARGIPTVSFFDPELSDAGVFVQVNTIDHACEAISKLLSQEEMWSVYSNNCRRYFNDNHDIISNVARYRALFVQVLQKQK